MQIKHFSLFVLTFLLGIGVQAQQKISIDSLQKTVYFLASDSLLGRSPGSAEMAKATQYIKQHFEAIQLKPVSKDYEQVFHFYMNKDNRGTNVIGLIEGSDPVLKNEYIVIGAHYDHIGTRFNDNDTIVYNGADDNASGVATILEVARLIAANKTQFKRSVLVIAFDAEEQGLLGSTHFLEHCPVDSKQIKYMMSIDMVGALNKGGRVEFNGANSMQGGKDYVTKVDKVEGLPLKYISGTRFWYSRTDTRPFYNGGIASMYVSTGLKSPYHKPQDDANIIDYNGMQKVAEQVYNTTLLVANKDNISFRKTESLIEVGPIVGLGFSHFNPSKGGITNKNRFMGYAGLATHTRLGRKFALQINGLYNVKGSRTSVGAANINCIDVPVSLLVMSKYDIARVFASFGGYYSHALSGKIADKDIEWDANNVNRDDYGLSFGFGFMLYNYQTTLKWNFGTTEYLKNALPQSNYFRSVELSLAYYL